MAQEKQVSFVFGAYAKYTAGKATYDTDGSIFFCTDKPILIANGNEIGLTDAVKAALEAQITGVDSKLAEYSKTTDIQSMIAQAKSDIIGGAGQDYDTLKEIETWINDHQDLYQALVQGLATKATITYVDEELAKKADKGEAYTKSEADEKFLTDHQSLAEYAKKTEVTAEIAEAVAPLATKQEVTSGLEGKADKSDTYTKNEVDTELGKKANSADVYSKSETYTKGEVDSAIEGAIDELGLEEALAAKANAADVYKKTETYTKEEVDAAIKVTDDKLVDYYKKTETYSQAQVDAAVLAAKNEILAMFTWKEA